MGGWGRGFVLALSTKWKELENSFRQWAKEGKEYQLGEVRFIEVTPDITVANMIGQHDTKAQNGIPPIRYKAVRQCLKKVAAFAKEKMHRFICPESALVWQVVTGKRLKKLLQKSWLIYPSQYMTLYKNLNYLNIS